MACWFSGLFGGRGRHDDHDEHSDRGEHDDRGNGGGRDTGRQVVFLSYAHETPEHKAQVRLLYDLLRKAGIEAVLDQVHDQEVNEKDWPLWCRTQIDRALQPVLGQDTAGWVLVIASAAYKRRADSPEQLPEDEGRGVWWEAAYLRDMVYNSRERANRILPVVLPGGSPAQFPNFVEPGKASELQIPALAGDALADLVATLRGDKPLSGALAGAAPVTGWVYAGANAGRASADTTREHILLRGRGHQAHDRGGDLFRGRVTALAAATGWLQRADAPGRVLVVTGQPGAGKSAVVARAALGLEAETTVAGRRLGLVFHARAATLPDFFHAMAVATGTSTADTLKEMLDRVSTVASPPSGCWRVVVDALDEATDADRPKLVEALTGLAALPTLRVVVATRALRPHGADRLVPGSLLHTLGVRSETDDDLVDLDNDVFFEPAGLVGFVTALLRQDGAEHPGPHRRGMAHLPGRPRVGVPARVGDRRPGRPQPPRRRPDRQPAVGADHHRQPGHAGLRPRRPAGQRRRGTRQVPRPAATSGPGEHPRAAHRPGLRLRRRR